MPDGDIIRRLSRLYQKPYIWLCEGKASTSECAWAVMKALKEDLKRKGDLPVILAQSMGEKLSQIVSGTCKNDFVDWAALSVEFDRLTQQTSGRYDLKELSLSAGKSVLHDLRYGREVNSDSFAEAILQRCMNKVYEASFKDCIPPISEHHSGISEVTLAERIEEIQPDIDATTSKWAKKVILDGSLANLRLPPRRQISKVSMDEDLLAG